MAVTVEQCKVNWPQRFCIHPPSWGVEGSLPTTRPFALVMQTCRDRKHLLIRRSQVQSLRQFTGAGFGQPLVSLKKLTLPDCAIFLGGTITSPFFDHEPPTRFAFLGESGRKAESSPPLRKGRQMP